MKIKKIEIMSFAKTWAMLNLLLGLITGVIFSLFSMIGISAGVNFFGIFAVILLPLIYGVIGFIWGILMAIFLNVALKFAGGIEFETSEK